MAKAKATAKAKPKAETPKAKPKAEIPKAKPKPKESKPPARPKPKAVIKAKPLVPPPKATSQAPTSDSSESLPPPPPPPKNAISHPPKRRRLEQHPSNPFDKPPPPNQKSVLGYFAPKPSAKAESSGLSPSDQPPPANEGSIETELETLIDTFWEDQGQAEGNDEATTQTAAAMASEPHAPEAPMTPMTVTTLPHDASPDERKATASSADASAATTPMMTTALPTTSSEQTSPAAAEPIASEPAILADTSVPKPADEHCAAPSSEPEVDRAASQPGSCALTEPNAATQQETHSTIIASQMSQAPTQTAQAAEDIRIAGHQPPATEQSEANQSSSVEDRSLQEHGHDTKHDSASTQTFAAVAGHQPSHQPTPNQEDDPTPEDDYPVGVIGKQHFKFDWEHDLFCQIEADNPRKFFCEANDGSIFHFTGDGSLTPNPDKSQFPLKIWQCSPFVTEAKTHTQLMHQQQHALPDSKAASAPSQQEQDELHNTHTSQEQCNKQNNKDLVQDLVHHCENHNLYGEFLGQRDSQWSFGDQTQGNVVKDLRDFDSFIRMKGEPSLPGLIELVTRLNTHLHQEHQEACETHDEAGFIKHRHIEIISHNMILMTIVDNSELILVGLR